MVKNILKTGGVALAGAALLAGCQSTEPTRAQMDAGRPSDRNRLSGKT